MNELDELSSAYKEYLKNNGGKDIQFPGVEFKVK